MPDDGAVELGDEGELVDDVTVTTQLVDEGLITEDEALDRVTGAQLARLMFPAFGADDDATKDLTVLGRGMGASPGAAVGKAVFDSATAVAWAGRGEDVVLVRRETTPDDLAGMIAAHGVLTSRGGKTRHAAVVARGMGKTCVCGAEELEVDTKRRRMTVPGGHVVEEGDVVRMTIRNDSGDVHPMHLHGHHAVVLSRDGEPSTGSPWWVDSLDVLDGETYEIAFVADNPGVWMDHCHNLDHAAEGLLAHLAYAGVTTPYRVGGGNEPE